MKMKDKLISSLIWMNEKKCFRENKAPHEITFTYYFNTQIQSCLFHSPSQVQLEVRTLCK